MKFKPPYHSIYNNKISVIVTEIPKNGKNEILYLFMDKNCIKRFYLFDIYFK